MRRHALLCLLFAASAFPSVAKDLSSNSTIKKQIIAESQASYPGNCACPYNTMRNGRSCGGRSAWSRRGGYAPICYENEVTPEMMASFRERHKTNTQ
ncbi:MAG TPA: hypothetical protein VIT92_10010 [Burkholderiaceae bacterium]